MAKFVERQVEIYDLPFPNGFKPLHPECVVLTYCKGHSIDFGALCYLRRSSERRLHKRGRHVDLFSFSKTRTREIQALVDHVSKSYSHSGLKSNSLHQSHGNFVRFIDWCDSNQHSNVLATKMSANAAFRGYVVNLHRLVTQNQLNINTGSCYQNDVLNILQDYLEMENLDRGVNLLIPNHCFTESISVPDDSAQEKVLAWCKCLFSGLSELVIDQKPYPFPLAVPGYLKWPHDQLWVFPLKCWCKPPNHKAPKREFAYDYHNGRVCTFEEIEYLYVKAAYPFIVRKCIKNAQKLIATSNQNFYSPTRIERGLLAVKAFLMIFIASTGCNPKQAVSTPWSEEIGESVRNPLVERQDFRTIKYRANMRPVTFEIGVEYMPYLRRYLQLRMYLLNGRRCEYLFFGYGVNNIGLTIGPTQLPASVSHSTYITLARLSPTLPRVAPSQWRAAKQDYSIRNHDPATAARAMQHSVATAIKHYSNGSEVTQQIELSAFFSQVEKVVLKSGQEVAGSEKRSVGICVSPNNPQAIGDNLPITPNCKGVEGCLFCDKYRIHSDQIDVRKILSARYCIKKISHLASNFEQFGRLFGGVLQRIDFIVNEVRHHDVKMLEKVEREVDVEGELDPFWSARLEMLMELELV